MAGLLDMLFGAQGWFPNSPLATTLGAQKAQDPYALAAQLGGMQTTDPQYAAIQAQMNDALSKQKSQAANLGLIAGGLGMMGARDQYGRPAGIVGGLSQGFEKGVAEDRDYLKNARELSGGLLGAQAQGQKIAGGRQTLEQNRLALETANKLMSVYHVADKDTAMMIAAAQSNSVAAQGWTRIAQDPNQPPDVKAKAAMIAQSLMNNPAAKYDGPKAVDAVFGKTLDPTTKANKEAQTAKYEAETGKIPSEISKNIATAGAMSRYSSINPSTGLPMMAPDKAHEAAINDAKILQASEGKFAAKMGSTIDYTAYVQMKTDQYMGKKVDLPPVPNDGEPHPFKDKTTGQIHWWKTVNGQPVPTGPPSITPTPTP